MLKLADESEREKIFSVLDGAFGAKIEGIISAYGFDSCLLQVWYDETASTVAARFDTAMTLCCSEKTDMSELANFLTAVGYSSLFASVDCFERLGIKSQSTGSIMKYLGEKKYLVSKDASTRLRDMYSLISESIPGSFDKCDYNYFLSDFTYRQRRGLARARCITVDGDIAACALTSAETKYTAVISGVASSSKYRGCGYGGRIVGSLAGELASECKDVYVFVLNEKARGFYEHIGFLHCGEWAQLILRKVSDKNDGI